MIAEFILANLVLASVELHSCFNISEINEYNLDTRVVLSKDYFNNTLVKKLTSNNPEIRIMAISQVGESKIKSAIKYVIDALNDEDYKIRGIAAMSLGKLEEVESIPHLTQALKDEHHGVRAAAALSLGRLKATESVDNLIESLEDPNFSVKMSATYALGVIADPKAIKPLIKLLFDDSIEIRENTAWTLGLLKAQEALPQLELLTQDPDSNVRATAKKAIFHIKYSIISDTSKVKYSGNEGSSINNAIKISGISNSFACIRSQKEFINSFYGNNKSWEQIDKIHIKQNNKHYDMITVKEAESGQFRKFYFDITEFFSKF